MTTDEVEMSISHSLTVDAPRERAFSVFTEGLDSWFPREYNLLAVDIAERTFEPREGGRIYDRGTDGSECSWGTVLIYEPPERVVFAWAISPHWQIEDDDAKVSEVEVRFTEESPERTLGRVWRTVTSIAMAKAGSSSASRSPPRAAGPGACSASGSDSRNNRERLGGRSRRFPGRSAAPSYTSNWFDVSCARCSPRRDTARAHHRVSCGWPGTRCAGACSANSPRSDRQVHELVAGW